MRAVKGRGAGAPALAAALAAAVLLVLAGCGGSDDGGGSADAGATTTATASATDTATDTDTATATQSPSGESDSESSDSGDESGGGSGSDGGSDGGGEGDAVPRDELTPAGGGSFTEAEKDYLEGRVPEGSDPAAILQLGEEACDRVGYLERHDHEAAVSALRDGEIDNAEAAIENLCPEYRDLWAEASGEDQ